MFEHPALVERLAAQHLRDLRHEAEFARQCQAPAERSSARPGSQPSILRRLAQLALPARRPAHA